MMMDQKRSLFCARILFGAVICMCAIFSQATQVCNQTCSKINDTVCGSDNVTYSSECEMNKTACNLAKNISVAHKGACQQDRSSNLNETRQISPPRQGEVTNAKEICNQNCSMINDTVCGSDNVTYSSECQLNYTACNSTKNIWVAYKGSCQQANCNQNCSKINDTVCGSDNVTYNNECQLNYTACNSTKNISVAYKGSCHQVADIIFAKQICNQNCSMINDTVCGSDNVTYNNECQLKNAACNSTKNISVAYKGSCQQGLNPTILCPTVPCDKGRVCKVISPSQKKCVCNDNCSKVKAPVCGTNGKTYDNECELYKERCLRNNKDLTPCKVPCTKNPAGKPICPQQ